MAALMSSRPWARVAVDAVVDSRTAGSWYALAYRLHDRVGRADDAERAYRYAIERGYRDAWVSLGVLLSAVPGRETDEEHAFRMALDSPEPEVVALAALKLGNIASRLHGDLETARSYFETAALRGCGVTARDATKNLAFLSAYQGDRAAATEGLRSALVASGDLRGVDMGAWAPRFAKVFAAVASSSATRELWRRYRVVVYRASRRRRALRTSSLAARLLGVLRQRIRPPSPPRRFFDR